MKRDVHDEAHGRVDDQVKRQFVFVPPMWLALSLSVVGIVGMNLVYQSLIHGGLWSGLIGGLLLAIAVVTVGTPLAFARMQRKKFRERPTTQ
ncbi:hypothetical protein JZ785_24105 [Alicyclobacillus curvatus]|nr:hypothetical protein JZ785_24105 [Alicyclobacillus curvatus]